MDAPETIQICGKDFDVSETHFSFEEIFFEITPLSDLQKLARLPHLQSADLGSTSLNDEGLAYFAKYAPSIENWNLQDTEITDAGISHLAGFPNLKYLRMKENYQLTNACIPALNQLTNLIDLQIHETKIDVEGLKTLILPKLTSLLVSNSDKPDFIEKLLQTSRRMPQCSILVKGRTEVQGGTILWTRD